MILFVDIFQPVYLGFPVVVVSLLKKAYNFIIGVPRKKSQKLIKYLIIARCSWTIKRGVYTLTPILGELIRRHKQLCLSLSNLKKRSFSRNMEKEIPLFSLYIFNCQDLYYRSKR